MSRYGVQLNSHILFTFLQGCWVARLSREQVARVFAEVAAMRAQQRPDRKVYAALLTFAHRHGVPDIALDIWAALQEASIHLSALLPSTCMAVSHVLLLLEVCSAPSYLL
jgi:hypothetical protein